jgi:predicted TIM-barrel fold metal-dependent hydrolase
VSGPDVAPRRVVDVHHHYLPPEVLSALVSLAGGAPRLVNERISITLSPLLADAGAHLEAMDAAGVDVAVLTYSGVSVLGTGVCAALNEGLAAVEAAHPGRFVGAAHVDLDDPAAVVELERCVGELGFRLLALPCSTPERALDDPSLERLWDAAESLDLPVVLHPAMLPAGASTDYGLERSCARPFDTTTAAVRLLSGVFPRHRKLRVVLPHCGGTAAFLRGRLQMFFGQPGGPPPPMPRTVLEQRREGIDEVFASLWSQLWFDTAGTGGWAPAVGFAASVVGADRLMWGSDFPLESHSGETVCELLSVLDGLAIGEADRAAIAGGTAEALFSVPVRTPSGPQRRPAGGGAAASAVVTGSPA